MEKPDNIIEINFNEEPKEHVAVIKQQAVDEFPQDLQFEIAQMYAEEMAGRKTLETLTPGTPAYEELKARIDTLHTVIESSQESQGNQEAA